MEDKQMQIPDGWERVKFIDNIFFQEGPGLMATLFKETGFPFMNIRCIENGKIKRENCQFVSNSIAENQYKHFQLQEDDLIVSTSGTLGKKAYVRKSDLPLLLNTSIIRFRPKYKNAISLHFLNYILESHSFLYDLYSQSTGSAQVNVGPTHIKKVFVTLPKSTTEQQKIAEILSNVDKAIEQTQNLIAKYQRIKTGLMQDLLTKGIDENGNIRNEETHEFKDSELGRVPKEWEVEKLETICTADITYGIVQAGPNIENGIPYIRTGDMSGNALELNGLLRTTPKIASKFKRSTVREGEIVFALRSTIGKVLLVPNELDGANLTQGTARISSNQNLVKNKFLIWCLRMDYFKNQILQNQKGTTFSEISLGQLRKMEVCFSKDIIEQNKIINILQAQVSLITDEQNKLEKYKSLKTALIQDLLSGKKRVTSLIKEKAYDIKQR